jgi:hypothetical protein
VTTCVLSKGRESGPEAATDILREEISSAQQMAIVEKYEVFINYVYPIAQNIPRKHGVARDAFLKAMFGQVDLFISAGKSRQVSRLYSADSSLSTLRFWLRFLSDAKRKLISPNQHRVAIIHLAEVGGMLNAWIRSAKSKG